jgi:hypothetical protein
MLFGKVVSQMGLKPPPTYLMRMLTLEKIGELAK